MCGIAGFLTSDPERLGSLEAVSSRMALAIQHSCTETWVCWWMKLPALCWHIVACLFLICVQPVISRWRRLAGGRLVFLIENIY